MEIKGKYPEICLVGNSGLIHIRKDSFGNFTYP